MDLLSRGCRVGIVSVLLVGLSACGSADEKTAAPTPTAGVSTTPTPTPTPTATPTPTPTKAKATPTKPVRTECVGTFKDDRFTLSANNGAGIYGGSFSCGTNGTVITAEQLRSSVRFYVGSKVVTIKPGKAAAIGGYTIRVKQAKPSIAVFTVTPR